MPSLLTPLLFALASVPIELQARTSQPPPSLTSHLEILRQALATNDWPSALTEADTIRSASPRASEPWFEASAAIVHASWWRFDQTTLESVARDALSASGDLHLADPDSTRSALGPLSPFAAGRVLQIRTFLAYLLQSRCLHDEALGNLSRTLDDLRRGPADGADHIHSAAQLASAWSHRALGHSSTARSFFQAVRDGFPGTREAAVATVALEDDLGPSAYTGKYAADPDQARRLESLHSALPAARRRVAAALGIDPNPLPLVLVGLSDQIPSLPSIGGFTELDPRRPAVPAVVVVFSEELALVRCSAVQVLTHELSHAIPMHRWGLRYEALPSWLNEALARAFAGEIEEHLEECLSRWVLDDCAAYVRDDFWETHPFPSEAGSPGREEKAESGLLGILLVEEPRPGGLARFVAEMEAGKSGEEALRAACGLTFEEYRRKAADLARARLESVRAASLPAIARIAGEGAKGLAEGLAAADRVLAEGGSSIARGFALLARAETLERLARQEESLAAWQEILDALPERPVHAQPARRGRVRALIALGRLEEAEKALVELRRDAVTPSYAAWADARLDGMESQLRRR